MIPSEALLLDLNRALSGGLFVLILLTQVLIYPSFLKVPVDSFASYHRFHCLRISWVVAPLMLLDGLVALFLWIEGVGGSSINAALSVLPLIATFAFFGPWHGKIEKSQSRELIETLVTQNIWRVVMWGCKLIYSFLMVGGPT